jgi:hypothetical protein
MTIWYILWVIWYISPRFVFCTKKNLAALSQTHKNILDVVET